MNREKEIRIFATLLFGVAGFVFNASAISNALSVFLIANAFDLFGYGGVMYQIRARSRRLYEQTLRFYRYTQAMFFVLIAAFSLYYHGVDTIIIIAIIYLSGFQDLLYYWVGGYKLPPYWTWLNWTYAGWFAKKTKSGKKRISNKVLIMQIVFSFIISIIYEVGDVIGFFERIFG